jgi:hypothetical protein
MFGFIFSSRNSLFLPFINILGGYLPFAVLGYHFLTG